MDQPRPESKRYYWASFGAGIYAVFLNRNRTVTIVGKIDKPSPRDTLTELKVKNGRA